MGKQAIQTPPVEKHSDIKNKVPKLNSSFGA
jgi:hypothetical protein